jgi:hypothetical protein
VRASALTAPLRTARFVQMACASKEGNRRAYDFDPDESPSPP